MRPGHIKAMYRYPFFCTRKLGKLIGQLEPDHLDMDPYFFLI